MARCVWALERGDVIGFLSQKQHLDAQGWLEEVMDTLPHDDLIRVVVTLWAIWHARRKAIHENTFQSPLSIHCFVDKYIAELEQTKPNLMQKQAVQTMAPVWTPPLTGFTEINVDVALSKNSNITVVAAIARDSAGVFLGASAMVLEGIIDAE